ncbi:DUF4304 domain-containing protein [Flammeovirga aprica]|uniref:DUF4304 domain-containing protein n=1 Tax=Flammeovirga aprica JL-4 TaxID=694437 RepID=A0A7X9RXP2_9BACT|nr:DUF4304 domain-containing protein [Flammeovirga aprica]NME70635.1 DUF4304 domain-containing protein [Flammeovirga aprica JL-4]
MNTSEFKKLIRKHYSPKIRELGWKGSGFHYRKVEDNHVVKIFGIQGSWYGGSICCETAIHFDFIPDLSGKLYNKTTYASCLIRERLSPKGVGDYHWDLKENEEENIKSINEIWETFSNQGQKFYNDFENFPEPFLSIQPNDFNQRYWFGFGKKKRVKILNKYHIFNEIHFIWLLKEINLFFGNISKAREFSELGIEIVNEDAIKQRQRVRGTFDQSYFDSNIEMFKI